MKFFILLICLTLLISSCGKNKNNTTKNVEKNPFTKRYSFITYETISTKGAPSARSQHEVFKTEEGFLVYGGYGKYYRVQNDGGRYNITKRTWENIPKLPVVKTNFSTAFAKNRLLVWGGQENGKFTKSGHVYDFKTKSWIKLSETNAPSKRYLTKAHTFQNKVLIWGGHPGCDIVTGSILNMDTLKWTKMPRAPRSIISGCDNQLLIGPKLYVWGHYKEDDIKRKKISGGAYFDITQNKWFELESSSPNYPTPREWPLFLGTNESFIVWGGINPKNSKQLVSNGSIYNGTNWTPIEKSTAPVPSRNAQGLILSNGSLFLWNTNDESSSRRKIDGHTSLYNLRTKTWKHINKTSGPTSKVNDLLFQYKDQVFAWGGKYNCPSDFGVYNLIENYWATIKIKKTHLFRSKSSDLLIGNKIIQWGGEDCNTTGKFLNSGSIIFLDTFEGKE